MRLTKFKDLPGESPFSKLTNWASGRPIYVQIKYNGIFAEWIPGVGLFTRQGKKWDLGRFPAEFVKRLPTDRVWHGELLIPGTSFQDACGILNVSSGLPIIRPLYKVFDAYQLDNSLMSFGNRLALLAEVPESPYISAACTEIFYQVYLADKAFHEYTSHDCEGCVYRIDPCLATSQVSPHAVKRKKIHTAEGICIAAEEGLGKRTNMLGALIIRLPNNTTLRLGGGTGITDKILTSLFHNPPIGQLITYTYEDTSDDGIPLRPQLLVPRNYE